MPTTPADETEINSETDGAGKKRRRALFALARRPLVRELLVVLAFCAFTAALTWPYATRLRDAVVDPGDPYLVSWILWWDYHATFTNPLHLFDANVFYPYRYTLAFSEHCYGLALPFFPLFALGLRPLTVQAVALFLGFALCGYGAFRLARTLTDSDGAAWVAGIVFAFVPFRFHLMSQLPYVFAAWVPLLFEALVLFARARTRWRAAWLGFTFLMTGLTTISWFTFSLVPFALAWALLATRYELWRERAFWLRGGAALGAASLALVPFMLPYYIVSKLYGFERSIEEVKANSAWPIHWLSVENRNKLWNGLGSGIADGWRFKLFPGLLPVLLSLAAVLLVKAPEGRALFRDEMAARRLRLRLLDSLIVLALALSVLAVGFAGTDFFGGLFGYVTSEWPLALLTVAVVARLCVAYPAFMRRGEGANLAETLRSSRRTEAFWLGLLLFVVGFCYSLGWNFFFYRILYDLLPVFRSMRVPTRGAMIAYLGLALLAGLGAQRLAELASERRTRLGPAATYAVLCALLLFELNGAPLKFMRGEVYPDAVTLRLKQTPMRGGIVVLPAGGEFNHRYILRAADHVRPLVVGTSGFNPPYETEIEALTGGGPIPSRFLDLLEKIPASYVVVENELVAPERREDYQALLARAVESGRLRFVNRFDGRDDLYAVAKTEPGARAEAPPPFGSPAREWSSLVEEDPLHLLRGHEDWSEEIYRVRLVATGRVPRYGEFMSDVREAGRGIVPGFEETEQRFRDNLRELADQLTRRESAARDGRALDDAHYVERLYTNAGLPAGDAEGAALADDLAAGRETRSAVLLKIADDPRLVERERNRALVVLHFFAYLRRSPGDPPDRDLSGLQHWVGELEHGISRAGLTAAFENSLEYQAHKEGR